MNLNDISLGDTVKILAIKVSNNVERQKLLAHGVLPGVVVTLARKAPLGCPIEIKLRGTSICMQSAVAEQIDVIGSS